MKKIRSIWLNLSIRAKILVFFSVSIFLISVFNIYLNNNNYNMMDQFNMTMTNYYEINELLNQAKANHHHLDQYIKSLDEEELKAFYETQEEMSTIKKGLFNRFSSREAYFNLKAIENSIDSYMPLWHESIELRQKNIETYYKPFYEGQNIYNYTEGYIQELLYISLREGASLYNELAKEAELMRRVSLLLISGVFFLILVFGVVFSDYIVKPIIKLAQSSEQIASGNLEVEAVQIETYDEIGSLAESFNIMSEHIRDYVKDLEQKAVIERKLLQEELAILKMKQLLKESEFQALQSQINPHFLFNTLNMISRTAMFEEAVDTEKLIKSLSNLFRYRIRNSGDTVSLEEEVFLIKEYMYLQKMRFKDRLKFEVVCHIPLSTIRIPVFTLQPIVENAIIHGIEPKIEGGTVRIKVRRNQENATVITITDTGMGIEKEKLSSLLKSRQKRKSKHIGVSNVYDRFMLHYGSKGAIKLYSRVGVGTVVKFIIDNGNERNMDV